MFTYKNKIMGKNILSIFTTLFSLSVTAQSSGGIGINTLSPEETLHVAGTFRVDSAPAVSGNYKLAVLDSFGTLKTLDRQLLPSQSDSVFYWEEDGLVTTTAGNFTPRTSFTIPAGTYTLSLYCEVRGGGGYGNVILKLTDGINDVCLGAPFCYHNQFCSWSCMKQMTLATPTTFQLLWYSATGGAPSTMRFLRIRAERQ